MTYFLLLVNLLLFSVAGGLPGLQQARSGAPQPPSEAADLEWFRSTEQSLMDAIASGDKQKWDRVMDETCVVTTEEGEVLSKEKFLGELNGLPNGLSGSIAVQDLTVQRLKDLAIVRFRLQEQENVFGQQLATQYRVTDTFRRVGSEWKMVASHASVVTIDPPPQEVSTASWPAMVGTYKLEPNGWTFHVALQDGMLYGGRNLGTLRPFIPLAPNVFTLKGALGEWIFVLEDGAEATKIVHFRKFEPLIWTRVRESK